MPASPILIAGGGIGGLACALAMAQTGRASVVLERQAEFSLAGAGIQFGPNGVRALAELGVADALEPYAGKPEAIEVFEGKGGRRLTRLPLGNWLAARHGAPYWVAHRGDLHAVLHDAAVRNPLIDIRTGFAVASVEQDDAHVGIASTTGERLTGALLVGADGLWSAVRQAAVPGVEPAFAGATATRTVISAENAGPLALRSVGLWLSPTAHVVHYPVRGGAEIAVVAIVSETWESRAWDAPADPEHLFRALQNLMRNSVEAIGDGFGEIAVRCDDVGDRSVIEVSDTGPGLPAHARENLFKAFKGSTHAGGAGLGLVNVQEIAQAHGGDIKLVKSDASGTVFRIHLPLGPRLPLRQAVG